MKLKPKGIHGAMRGVYEGFNNTTGAGCFLIYLGRSSVRAPDKSWKETAIYVSSNLLPSSGQQPFLPAPFFQLLMSSRNRALKNGTEPD